MESILWEYRDGTNPAYDNFITFVCWTRFGNSADMKDV